MFLLFAVLLCATTSCAQTTVSTNQNLRYAITDGANIKVTADIDLSNSTLSIENGSTVTIDSAVIVGNLSEMPARKGLFISNGIIYMIK